MYEQLLFLKLGKNKSNRIIKGVKSISSNDVQYKENIAIVATTIMNKR